MTDKIDDRHEIFNIYESQCSRCKNFNNESYSCEAYPDGIPENLLDASEKHDKVRKGQTGNSIFSPKDSD